MQKTYNNLNLPNDFDPIKTNYRIAGFMDGIKGLTYGAALVSGVGAILNSPIYGLGVLVYFLGKLIDIDAKKIRAKAKRMQWTQQECYDNPNVHKRFMDALKKDELERLLKIK